MKGLPKLALLERLSDLAAPLAATLRGRLLQERVRAEMEVVEGGDVDAAAAFIEVRQRLQCSGARAMCCMQPLHAITVGLAVMHTCVLPGDESLLSVCVCMRASTACGHQLHA